MSVIITEKALREVANIIEKTDELNPETVRLRVGVKGGGCSGFSYLLDLTENQKDSDEEWEYEIDVPGADGGVATKAVIKVICDPKSYLYLNGTTVDFKDTMMQKGFIFENPNATSTCGCGSSFSA